MHNNYFFLRQLSDQLKKELTGFSIAQIFSQVKDELIISLYKKTEERFINAHLAPQFCCLSFPEAFNRARKNSVDLFPLIIDHEILDVCQIEHDRSFYFQCTDDLQLLFKMHGNRSNVVLIQQEKVVDVFKKNLKQDFHLTLDQLTGQINLDRKSFEIHQGDYKKLIPTFGKSFDPYFESRHYSDLDFEEKYSCLTGLLTNLEHPDFFIHHGKGHIPKLNLFRIHPNDQKIETPTEALNLFYRKYIYIHELEKEKSAVKNVVNAQIKKGESWIANASYRLKKLQSTLNYKHIGDLIMANLHNIKPRANEIALTDFYSQELMKIQLKPTLSPQLNAEKYYKKAKNQRIEIDTLQKNIERRKIQIDELKHQLLHLEEISDRKQLEKKKKTGLKTDDRPYLLALFMNYEILIGKNAVKNEQLTFQIAKKDDLFLHAKDVPGSHVIIKKKTNQNFPEAVIEQAASFAAFYSKYKSGGLCRVLYTPRKYVRKAKGKPAGTVIVEREKVMLAMPEKLKGDIKLN